MNNLNETDFKIHGLSVTIEKASVSLHSAIKYIYAVSVNDLYNINVRDLFQVSLSDINNPNILSNLGVAADIQHMSIFNSEEFARLSDLFFYAFAVRVAFLRRNTQFKGGDRFLLKLFNACAEKGAADPNGVTQTNFAKMLKAAKSKQPEPPFDGEWFRRWVYSYGGELSAITNRNMFLLGCMDALLPLYYAKLTEISLETLDKA